MKRLLLSVFSLFLLVAPAYAEELLELELDKGKLLHLNSPIRSVFIANPNIADVQMMSSNSMMVFGRASGETTLIAVDDKSRTVVNRRVVVVQNLSALREALKVLVPNAKIDVTAVPGGIVLNGDVHSPSQAEDARRVANRFLPSGGGEIINRLTIAGPTQVMLQVRIAEMLRTVDKTLGFNWEGGGVTGGGEGFAFGRGIDLQFDPITGALARSANGADNLLFQFGMGGLSMNLLLDALENEGLVSILAEPSLTAMSGETASFLAGGEFPVPVPSDDGIQIEYKSFGVSLSFTPTLLDHERINVRIRPEVSQLSSANNVNIEGSDIPSLITRRADTTVELGSGQSFAIAGLLQNNTNQSTDKFPVLGDLPVIGALFRSEAFTRDESELVIIVTPYIVRPTNERLATPVDNFDVPSDSARIFMNEKLNEVKAEPFARIVDEPINFIVE
jgi:pilus assembly protein CpaC